MGFFDKMFEKKECAICGTELGLLGKTKINEGYLCKECAGKLSPYFHGYRSSTADDIREQLAYREANAERLASFNPTRTLSAGRTNIMLDEDAGLLIITSQSRWRDANPDIIEFSQGPGCDMDVDEHRTELYRETDEKYVEPCHPIQFLPWDSNSFIMQSRKDGYNHLYLCTLGKHGSRMASNTESLEIKQLTSGKWEVMEVLGFNSKRKSIIIASNEKSPIQRNIFAVDTKTGKRTLVDDCGKGWHSATLSENGQYVFDNYSTPTMPRKIALVNTENGKRTAYFTAENPWKGYNVPEYSCGTIKAADGETDLYWRMVKPVNFNPNKKYPTIIYVYGGPHAHNVDARWNYSSRGWETYMAEKGYLLFILDNRGSENRGKAFEQATFRQLGQIEMQDQMKGVEYLKTLPYVDADKIGVHGWSFGGFMTISLMTNHPDVFKVGVAGGPVIDWHWYEVMYGERYMDTPQTNPEGYKKTSLLYQAKNLKGKLQIIQGLNDVTVVPQHCLTFLKACIAAGTQPDFFVYPGEPHNMRGHQSTHLHERISNYFFDYLK